MGPNYLEGDYLNQRGQVWTLRATWSFLLHSSTVSSLVDHFFVPCKRLGEIHLRGRVRFWYWCPGRVGHRPSFDLLQHATKNSVATLWFSHSSSIATWPCLFNAVFIAHSRQCLRSGRQGKLVAVLATVLFWFDCNIALICLSFFLSFFLFFLSFLFSPFFSHHWTFTGRIDRVRRIHPRPVHHVTWQLGRETTV